MSQENVEVVRRFFKDRTAFLQGETDRETAFHAFSSIALPDL